MHFRWAIIIALVLVLTGGGVVYWELRDRQATPQPATQAFYDSENNELSKLDTDVAEFQLDLAGMSLLDGTLADVASDQPAETVSVDSLTQDANDLDSLDSSIASQSSDQTDANSTLTTIEDLNR